MRVIYFLVSMFWLAALPGVAGDAGEVSMRGILVIASNAPGEPDPQLAPYDATLRRILRFESFRAAGGGAATVAVPGTSAISLGRGHRLEIETQASGGQGVRAQVRWTGGGRTFMNTGLVLSRGVPAVLGGPPTGGGGGEVYAVIVIVQ